MLMPGTGVLWDAAAHRSWRDPSLGDEIGSVSALAVSHRARWGPSPAPCPTRLHPAPLEEELVRPLPGWQPGLLPR